MSCTIVIGQTEIYGLRKNEIPETVQQPEPKRWQAERRRLHGGFYIPEINVRLMADK